VGVQPHRSTQALMDGLRARACELGIADNGA
jgi:hypothetical protein